MKRFKLPRRLPTWVAVVVLALVVVPVAFAAATNSTTDPGQMVNSLQTGACVHPNQSIPINCNEYAQKEDVFLNGSPSTKDAGTYFFAVLAPGGQGEEPNPADGGAKNLSDTDCAPDCALSMNSDGTPVPSGYAVVNREFTVDEDGNIHPLTAAPATHAYVVDENGNGRQGSLSVWPFDDTSNPGGVYILATCKINSDPTTTDPIANPALDKGSCKYDAFKVQAQGGTTQPAADLVVTKDATPSFTRTFTWGISKSADQSKVYTAGGAESGPVNYTVEVTHDGGTDSAWQVAGSIDVFNPNDGPTPFTGVNVSDQITYLKNGNEVADPSATCALENGSPGDVDPTNATIPALATVEFQYTCTYSAAPAAMDETNNATATWDPVANGGTPDSSNTFPVDFGFETPTSIVDGSVDVADSVQGDLGTVSYSDASPKDITYQLNFTDPAGTCTDHKNTATATTDDTQTAIPSNTVTVTDCQGSDLTVSKDVTPSFTRTYMWGITKSADTKKVFSAGGGVSGPANYDVTVTHDTGTDSGWAVKGTITITNPNDWEDVTLTSLDDALDVSGDCSVDPGPYVVPKSDSLKVGYTCSSADPTDTKNTATATWDASKYSTPSGSASGDKPVDFSTVAPKIVDGSVSVSDSLHGNLGTVSYTDASPKDFTYQLTFTDPTGTCTDHANTATATTDDTQTAIPSNTVTVTDCQGSDLTVSKTATGSFTRDYDWSVVKSQTTSSTPINSTASNVTVAYNVKATWSGPADSGWKVIGSITVHNPNNWESIKLTGVSDAIDNGGTCTVSGDTSQTIAASSDSIGLTYTCTYLSAPSPAAGTNTATATWDKSADSTPHGTNSGTAGVDFSTVIPTVTHNTTTVTDTFNGGAATTLGVANINGTFTKAAGNTLTAFASSYSSGAKTFTFTYTRSVPVVADICKTYNNTAAISSDATSGNNSSNASVTICGPVAGGLTMGFWQNNNGQAIVKGGASTSGVCNSGTYLRTFAPFQDLSATATCAQVATYVGNVIKNDGGVNCGGSSCNSLLKAQMLATALNVYFSDTALGGNKIGAPGPLAGVKVNITSFSAGFGGSTCMSVSDMLSYAASKSNSGGSIWYAQVKATQERAMSAFNAINNAIVTTC